MRTGSSIWPVELTRCKDGQDRLHQRRDGIRGPRKLESVLLSCARSQGPRIQPYRPTLQDQADLRDGPQPDASWSADTGCPRWHREDFLEFYFAGMAFGDLKFWALLAGSSCFCDRGARKMGISM